MAMMADDLLGTNTIIQGPKPNTSTGHGPKTNPKPSKESNQNNGSNTRPKAHPDPRFGASDELNSNPNIGKVILAHQRLWLQAKDLLICQQNPSQRTTSPSHHQYLVRQRNDESRQTQGSPKRILLIPKHHHPCQTEKQARQEDERDPHSRHPIPNPTNNIQDLDEAMTKIMCPDNCKPKNINEEENQ
jgi:hypothetical protein